MSAEPEGRLVLASASPRRRELLDSLGLDFTVRPAAVDETPDPGERPRDLVRRLAREKAEAAAREGEWVLAADTIVVTDGAILGKPADRDEARKMLERLQGRWHLVPDRHGAPAAGRRHAPRGRKHPRPLRRDDHRADRLVRRHRRTRRQGRRLRRPGSGQPVRPGDRRQYYSNVVGLPLPTVRQLFEGAGGDLRTFRRWVRGSSDPHRAQPPLGAPARGRRRLPAWTIRRPSLRMKTQRRPRPIRRRRRCYDRLSRRGPPTPTNAPTETGMAQATEVSESRAERGVVRLSRSGSAGALLLQALRPLPANQAGGQVPDLPVGLGQRRGRSARRASLGHLEREHRRRDPPGCRLLGDHARKAAGAFAISQACAALFRRLQRLWQQIDEREIDDPEVVSRLEGTGRERP